MICSPILSCVFYYVDELMETNQSESQGQEQQQQMTKKKLKLSFEDYKILSNMIVAHIRNVEKDAGKGNNYTKESIVLIFSVVTNGWYHQT